MATIQGATAPASTPDVAGRGAGAQARPNIAPAPGFYYLWHPMKWHVMRGRVVPQLKKLSFVAGADAMQATRNGKPDPALAVSLMQQRGWSVIAWDVDGPGTSYVKPDGIGGWIDRFQKLYPGSSKVQCDEDGYSAWCESLVTRGEIPPAIEFVLEELKDDYVQWNRRLIKQKDHATAEHFAGLVQFIDGEIEKMRADLEPLPDLEGVPDLGTVKPKRARRTKEQIEADKAEKALAAKAKRAAAKEATASAKAAKEADAAKAERLAAAVAGSGLDVE